MKNQLRGIAIILLCILFVLLFNTLGVGGTIFGGLHWAYILGLLGVIGAIIALLPEWNGGSGSGGRRFSWLRLQIYLLPLVIGFLVGVFTLVGRIYIPARMNFLVRPYLIWLIPAFLIPYYLRSDVASSIIMSVVSLIASVLGYYLFQPLMNGHGIALGGYMLGWLGYALGTGLLLGLAASFANTSDNLVKYICMGLLPAVFLSEGFSRLIHHSVYKGSLIATIITIAVGIVLYLAINSSEALRARSLLVLFCLVLLGLMGFGLYFAVSV